MKRDLQPAPDLLDKFPEFELDLAERIVEHLANYGGTTFAELQDRFSDLCVENEDLGYEWTIGASNVVIWTHFKLKGLCTLVHLRRTDVVELYPCPLYYYIMDGRVLTYPEAKRPPRHGYSKPHWIPTVVHLTK